MAQVHERLKRSGWTELRASRAERSSGALLPTATGTTRSPGRPRTRAMPACPDVLPLPIGRGRGRRPYFEIPVRLARRAGDAAGIRETFRRLRRVEDDFVYEPVVVGSFEDAVLAVVFNANLQAVVISDGFRYHHRSTRCPRCARSRAAGCRSPSPHETGISGILLAQMIRTVAAGARRRISTTDRDVASLAGSAEAAPILRGSSTGSRSRWRSTSRSSTASRDRYETPYFDNLKHYAQRPIGTFHALPIARGKSIFKSELDPRHGRVLRRQPVPRRVVGDDRRGSDSPPRAAPATSRSRRTRRLRAPRRRPQLLRDQRHVDVEQDRPRRRSSAGRHRPDRPRLPQVAPLPALSAGGRPATPTSRRLRFAHPSTRRRARASPWRLKPDQEGAYSSSGHAAELDAARQRWCRDTRLLFRRPRPRTCGSCRLHAGRVSRDQAGHHLLRTKGVVLGPAPLSRRFTPACRYARRMGAAARRSRRADARPEYRKRHERAFKAGSAARTRSQDPKAPWTHEQSYPIHGTKGSPRGEDRRDRTRCTV